MFKRKDVYKGAHAITGDKVTNVVNPLKPNL